MLIWGILFLFVIIGLFVVSRLLRATAESRVKGQVTPFAMTPEDIDKLKAKGKLTEEELKKVREAMARKFLERAKEEEETRRKPVDAAVALAAEEERILRGEAKDPAMPPSDEPEKRESPEDMMPEPEPDAGRENPAEALPERLRLMLEKSGEELEELRAAGFLDEADLELIEKVKGKSKDV